jgi:hypothetical protein
VIITSKLPGDKPLAKLIEPFFCTRFVVSLTDPSGNEKFRVDSSSLQCGIGWRGSLFGKCYEVIFPIFRHDNPSVNFEAADGFITKKHSACAIDEEVENAEDVEVHFPKHATAEDKFLLVCLALNIDYRFYEQNPHEITSEARLEG